MLSLRREYVFFQDLFTRHVWYMYMYMYIQHNFVTYTPQDNTELTILSCV